MENKKALIIGAYGQDGSYMSELLERKGYEVYGLGRGFDFPQMKNLIAKVDEIYNFAGISNVLKPFDNMAEIELIHTIPRHILHWINGTPKRFFQASSSLMYGRSEFVNISEDDAFAPIHPYGCAKLYAHNIIKEYREVFGVYAVSGIFFPHTSERQKLYFFLSKIAHSIRTKTQITVGNLNSFRDFGYAPEYMEAAYLMMHADEVGKAPKDYVIGTGNLTQLRVITDYAYQIAGLDYRNFVEEAGPLSADPIRHCADASLIRMDLGWQSKKTVADIIQTMINNYGKTI